METNFIQLVKERPEVMLIVKAGELREMVQFCVLETKKSIEQQITDLNTEKYISPQKTAEVFDVNLSTLWRWQKQGYLTPIELGGKRKYRQSDIDKLLKKDAAV